MSTGSAAPVPEANRWGRNRAATLSVGMAVGLAAVAMTFATVLLAYGVVRVQAPAWPPPGEQPPPDAWPWPWAATLVALAGSVVLASACRFAAAKNADTGIVARRATAAAAFGALFIAIQVTSWVQLFRSGVRPESGIVASVVYALTLFHALHALVALAALMPLLYRALRGRAVREASLAAVASFWHLVTAVWIVVFLAVFVA